MSNPSSNFLLVCLSVTALSANAADKLLITGVDSTSDSSSYLFVGALIPLPDNSLAHGYAVHLWTDYLQYSYASGANKIKAKANSVSVAIAFHDSGSEYWWNVKIGASQSNTRLTPDDLNNNSRGVRTDIKFGLGGELGLASGLKINGIFDYGIDGKSYWSRVRLLWKFSDYKYHGPEIIYQGDPSYDIQQFGWAITGIAIQKNVSLGFKAGIRKSGDDDFTYIGIDLVMPY